MNAFDLSNLPALNAMLNASAAALLLAGFACIRSGQRRAHAVCMSSAFGVSMLFLTSYLYYHYHYPATRFSGEGLVRTFYLCLLASHVLLAMVVPPMAIYTLWRAARREYDRHRRVARWFFPIWLYVSVTGVAIYWMLRPYYAG